MGQFWTVHPNEVFMPIRIRSEESHWKPGCSQLDVEDVLSNVFQSNAAGVTNFSIVWRTLRSDKCRRSKRGSTKCGNCEEGKKARHKSNITSFQVNKPCNSKFWLVLFYCFRGGGRCWAKLFPWGKIYIVLFCYCYHLLFQPRPPLLQSKPPPAF